MLTTPQPKADLATGCADKDLCRTPKALNTRESARRVRLPGLPRRAQHENGSKATNGSPPNRLPVVRAQLRMRPIARKRVHHRLSR